MNAKIASEAGMFRRKKDAPFSILGFLIDAPSVMAATIQFIFCEAKVNTGVATLRSEELGRHFAATGTYLYLKIKCESENQRGQKQRGRRTVWGRNSGKGDPLFRQLDVTSKSSMDTFGFRK